MSVLTGIAEDEEEKLWRLRTVLRCMRGSKDQVCLTEQVSQDVDYETNFLDQHVARG